MRPIPCPSETGDRLVYVSSCASNWQHAQAAKATRGTRRRRVEHQSRLKSHPNQQCIRGLLTGIQSNSSRGAGNLEILSSAANILGRSSVATHAQLTHLAGGDVSSENSACATSIRGARLGGVMHEYAQVA